jgi:hypothetical protein
MSMREATLRAVAAPEGDEAEPSLVSALARADYQLLRTAANGVKGAKPTPQLATGLLALATRNR